MVFYAHSVEGKPESEWHLLREHLQSTAQMAGHFASAISAGRFGQAAGLLHDIGKYSKEFQSRLRGKQIQVDHSTAGAREALEYYDKAVALLLGYVIAGHHAGLPDYGSEADGASLCGRLSPNYYALPDCKAYAQEITGFPVLSDGLPIRALSGYPGFSLQFFIRFLYSCLVDADFLDTESVLNREQAAVRGQCADIGQLLKKAEEYLVKITANAPETQVNKWRARILAACREKAVSPPGLFTLTVPTGGGKTLSSLMFALRHAKRHNMERIIYVIPYTSIIEQNADVFRKALGDKHVLEHHSNYLFSEKGDDNWSLEQYRLRLATENWDAPVIVTTNVQFFESLFAAKSSRCRKVHNIANSVVILDEAQMLPVSYLKPCLLSLVELTRNYHTSVVFCTATQPALKSYLPEECCPIELAPDPETLYNAFRRVQVKKVDKLPDEQLADELSRYEQVLCIVNTRRHAAELYKRLDGEGTYHLSALMYPAHRSVKLDRIRAALKNGETCRVVSTQLIEAGVDVDFPVVYRALAGVDSLAQAAGRCNREGRQKSGTVYVFKPERHGMPRGWLARTAAVADMVLRYHDDPLNLDTVENYFRRLYDIEGDGLDEKGIVADLEEQAARLAFPFRKVAAEFKIIEENTVPVIIPRELECRQLVEQAKWQGPSGRLSRAFQPYTVQVYEHEYRALVDIGALELVADQYLVLRDLSLYKDETGLNCKESGFLNDVLIQ